MKFDLHMHSRASYDSFTSMDDIAAYARRRHIDGIAVTDHNAFTASLPAARMGVNGDLWLVSGSEIYTEFGDIIALFIAEPLRSTGAENVIDEIHEQGGLAVLAHPFKRVRADYPMDLLQKLDAIDVINSRWVDLNRFKHLTQVRRLLSSVKGRSAGSDAHFAFEVGRAYLETPNLKGIEELKQHISNGTGVPYCDKYSEWLDMLSQIVKLLKRPDPKQFARVVYWSLRKTLLQERNTINGPTV